LLEVTSLALGLLMQLQPIKQPVDAMHL